MTELDMALPEALRLAAALWRGRGDHVARLLDVDGAGDALLRLTIEDGSVPLGDVLARDLTLSEAVTLLVPIADCVDALAVAGVVHGGICVAAIRFDERGAPVLSGFGAARVAGEGAAPIDPAVDRIAFLALARIVLADVTDAVVARDEIVNAIDEIDLAVPGALAALAQRLLAAAVPEPVRLGLPARPPALAPAPAARGRWTRRLRRPFGALQRRRGGVRRKFWMSAVGAMIGLGAAFVWLPVSAATTDDAPSVGLDRPTTSTPRPTVSEVERPESTIGGVTIADPVSAVLRLRRDATSATVIDDYGDVVLLQLETPSGPETLLIERTDAGWRVRDTLPRAE